jgi:hypothetical protein
MENEGYVQDGPDEEEGLERVWKRMKKFHLKIYGAPLNKEVNHIGIIISI